MRRALDLARKGEGSTRPNPPVGAVIVRGRRLEGEGWHRKAGGPHAEIVALSKARRASRGATLYVTLEPCCTHGRTGPCTRAIIDAGIRRVVAAIRDPNPRHRGRGIRVLRRAGIRVDVGACQDEATALIAPFAKHITTGRPFVSLKLASSLDGKIADLHGRSRWISGPAARRWVRSMRRRVDAVMVGAGTARADDPGLLSFDRGRPRGYRIAVSSDGRLRSSLGMISGPNADRTIVAVSDRCPERRRRSLAAGGASVWVLPRAKDGGVKVQALMARLGSAGFLHVLCEGGGHLAYSLVKERAVDVLHFVVAGRLIGGGGVSSIGGAGWRLPDAPMLRIESVSRLGRDVLVSARVGRPVR